MNVWNVSDYDISAIYLSQIPPNMTRISFLFFHSQTKHSQHTNTNTNNFIKVSKGDETGAMNWGDENAILGRGISYFGQWSAFFNNFFDF